jgi:diguanylate cyclase
MSARPRVLPRLTYRFRVLGMGLAALPLGVVLHDLDAGWPAWAWMVATCFAWPHLAYLLAVRSRDPYAAEARNFLVDSVFAGSWLPLMHFNLLPSAVLLTVVTADKVNSGVPGLWLKALPGTLLAMLAVGLATGFAVDYPSRTAVVLACLPILVIHTLAVSANLYRLMRRVQQQNQQLEELARRDSLTGLDSRGHWQAQARRRLARQEADAPPMTLVLIDIDHFKRINDQFGHAAGDDVLRALAALLRTTLPPGQVAGRLGGDEFAVLLPLDLDSAKREAERLREAVQAAVVEGQPGLAFSISLGLAAAPAGGELRAWMEAADRALYRAKRGGRNRTEARAMD